MRFEGTLQSWNDERGFGFIAPSQGGEPVFVHIQAFRGLRGRPRDGLRLQFELQAGERGKKRAVNVQLLTAPRARPAQSARPQRGTAPWPLSTWLSLLAFGLMLALGYGWGQPPRWCLWLYPLASAFTFMAYAMDKSAAQRGAWRIAEKTLHLLALAGGWPGALLAQQWLRHKSAKAQFRAVFWLTVLLNMAAFAWLASPGAQAWLAR